MTTTDVSSYEMTQWQLTFMETLELPNWFTVPYGDEAESEEWVDRTSEALAALVPAGHEEAVRDELGFALTVAATDDVFALFSVWPVPHPVSLLCGVQLLSGPFRPDPADYEKLVAHAAEGEHLGPGIQYTGKRTVMDGTDPVDLVSVSYVFTDGEITVVFTLSEAPAAVVTRALVDLTLLKDALSVRYPDGSRFRAVTDDRVHDDTASWATGDGN